MLAFILLIALPAACCFVAVGRNHRGARVLRLGNSAYIRQYNPAISVFFLLLWLMLALRDNSVGRDLPNYAAYFHYFRTAEWSAVMEHDLDMLYILLNLCMGKTTDSFQIFLAVVAALTLLPIWATYRQEKGHAYLRIVMFLGVGVFPMLFSGIRQFLAMSVGMVSWHYTKKRKVLPFLLSVLAAVGFHHSAFILLLMYPVYRANWKEKHLWLLVPVITAVFILRRELFALLGTVLPRYSFEIEETGAYGTLAILILFGVFCYVIPEEEKMDAELLGLRNLLILSILLQCFAPIHMLAMRFNYYYLLFIPILIPKIIDGAKVRWRQMAKLGGIVIAMLYTATYIVMLCRFSSTGESPLDILPYVPFWKT